MNNTDFARIGCLYDTLAWQDAEARPYLRVAEEMTPIVSSKTGTSFNDWEF